MGKALQSALPIEKQIERRVARPVALPVERLIVWYPSVWRLAGPWLLGSTTALRVSVRKSRIPSKSRMVPSPLLGRIVDRVLDRVGTRHLTYR
jgi:hypothetical protein